VAEWLERSPLALMAPHHPVRRYVRGISKNTLPFHPAGNGYPDLLGEEEEWALHLS